MLLLLESAATDSNPPPDPVVASATNHQWLRKERLYRVIPLLFALTELMKHGNK